MRLAWSGLDLDVTLFSSLFSGATTATFWQQVADEDEPPDSWRRYTFTAASLRLHVAEACKRQSIERANMLARNKRRDSDLSPHQLDSSSSAARTTEVNPLACYQASREPGGPNASQDTSSPRARRLRAYQSNPGEVEPPQPSQPSSQLQLQPLHLLLSFAYHTNAKPKLNESATRPKYTPDRNRGNEEANARWELGPKPRARRVPSPALFLSAWLSG